MTAIASTSVEPVPLIVCDSSRSMGSPQSPPHFGEIAYSLGHHSRTRDGMCDRTGCSTCIVVSRSEPVATQ